MRSVNAEELWIKVSAQVPVSRHLRKWNVRRSGPVDPPV
jgi:hypothetical protein